MPAFIDTKWISKIWNSLADGLDSFINNDFIQKITGNPSASFPKLPSIPDAGNKDAVLPNIDNTDNLPGKDSVSPPIQATPETPSDVPSTLPGDDRLDDHTDYGFLEYLEGLFASAGAENETNRLYNSAQAALNREFQHNEAKLQRDWYEAMSSSAYQRAMSDMKAAGLNPILAYSQGGAASAGTGVPTGSASSYNVGSGDTLSNVLTALADMITSLTGASASKIDKAFKLFKLAGG